MVSSKDLAYYIMDMFTCLIWTEEWQFSILLRPLHYSWSYTEMPGFGYQKGLICEPKLVNMHGSSFSWTSSREIFLAMWQENASHMQTHAVVLLPWIPIPLDFLHVYPSQPDTILFHLKRDNHLDVLPRSIYQFIVGAQRTFIGWLSFKLRKWILSAFMLSRINLDLRDEE